MPCRLHHTRLHEIKATLQRHKPRRTTTRVAAEIDADAAAACDVELELELIGTRGPPDDSTDAGGPIEVAAELSLNPPVWAFSTEVADVLLGLAAK